MEETHTLEHHSSTGSKVRLTSAKDFQKSPKSIRNITKKISKTREDSFGSEEVLSDPDDLKRKSKRSFRGKGSAPKTILSPRFLSDEKSHGKGNEDSSTIPKNLLKSSDDGSGVSILEYLSPHITKGDTVRQSSVPAKAIPPLSSVFASSSSIPIPSPKVPTDERGRGGGEGGGEGEKGNEKEVSILGYFKKTPTAPSPRVARLPRPPNKEDDAQTLNMDIPDSSTPPAVASPRTSSPPSSQIPRIVRPLPQPPVGLPVSVERERSVT